MAIEDDVKRHEEHLLRLDTCVDDLGKALATLTGSQSTVEMLLKWVIVPLLVILGGLIGIKLMLPGA